MKPVYFAKYLVVNFENKMPSLTSVNDAQLCKRASSDLDPLSDQGMLW